MITFLHTADWQIGRSFKSFPDEAAQVLADARLSVIDRIADAARNAGARFILVAGDAFDAADLTGRLFRQPIDKLARHADMSWHILPGNHDPVRPASVWERLARVGPPSNVQLHLSATPIEIAPGVWLLPAPVVAGGRSGDPTIWMNEAATPSGAIRIGLAHGSVREFGSACGAGEGFISPARAREARLDYLALGDWHGRMRIDPRTWYSGTPEPDRFLDNDPGSSLIVRIGGAEAQPAVEVVQTGRFIWCRRHAVVEAGSDLERLEAELLAAASEPGRLVLRISIEGRLSIGDMARFEAWQSVLAERVRHLEVDASQVRMATGNNDASRFNPGSQLHAAAGWLQEIIDRPDEAQRPIAEAALVRLLALSGDLNEGVEP